MGSSPSILSRLWKWSPRCLSVHRAFFRPGVERLEDRETPAGNVTAVLSGGTLTIVGVNDLRFDSIVSGLNNQDLVIAGSGAGAFSLTSTSGTTFNGAASASFTSVKNIKCDLRLGNDAVTVNNANLEGNLTFLGGSGNNALIIGGAAGDQSFGSISVINGEGNAYVYIQNGVNKITGALIINNGSQNGGAVFINDQASDELSAGSISITNGNKVTVVGNRLAVSGPVTIANGGSSSITQISATTVSIGGLLSVVGTSGPDNLTLGTAGGTVVGKGVTIRNGAGNSVTTFDASTCKLAGSVSVSNSDGTDTLNANNLELTGNLSINNGIGDSTVTFGGGSVKITGNLSIVNGAGADALHLSTSTIFELTGGMTVNNGLGACTLDSNTSTTIHGNLRLTALDGDDTFTSAGANFAVDGATTVSTGNGNTRFTLGAATNSFGDLSVRGAVGSDEVVLNTITTAKSVAINLGNGTALISIRAPLSIVGNLTVNLAEGADSITALAVSVAVTGATTLNTGAGRDTIVWLPTACQMGGNLTINMADGVDSVSLFNLKVAGAVLVDTGASADAITITDCEFNNSVALLTGSGNDEIGVAISTTSVPTQFARGVTIRMGSGDDTLVVGQSSVNDFASFLVSVLFDGGTDLDTAIYLPTGGGMRHNVFGTGQPLIAGFEVRL